MLRSQSWEVGEAGPLSALGDEEPEAGPGPTAPGSPACPSPQRGLETQGALAKAPDPPSALPSLAQAPPRPTHQFQRESLYLGTRLVGGDRLSCGRTKWARF